MSKLSTILFILVALVSCKAPQLLPETKVIIQDSIVVKTDTFYRKQIVNVPGDSVKIKITIPCPEAKNLNLQKQHNKTSLSVKSDDQGNLEIDCKADSLQLVVDSLITVIKDTKQFHSEVKTIVVPKPVKVKEWYIPKWVWLMILFNLLYFGWKFRSPIGAFVKKIISK